MKARYDIAVWWLGLFGCRSVSWVDAPALAPPSPESGVALVAQLTATAPTPCWLDVQLDSGDHQRRIAPPDPAADLSLPLLGLRADRDYDVAITCVDERGRVLEAELTWTTEPLPQPFPTLTSFAHDPARMAAGYTLLDASSDEVDLLLVLDADLEVVWLQRAEPPHLLTVTTDDDGTLLGNVYPSVLRMDWLGSVQQRVTPSATEDVDVEVAWPLHHEAAPLPDGGVLGLARRERDVAAVPLTYDDPATTAPGRIVDDGVIVLTEAGETAAVHWLSDVLDPARIGFDSLELGRDSDTATDWAHANAVAPDPRDGGFLVTLRHQDAVVKLTAQGQLDWILGTPSGWQPPWADALLTPTSEVTWPFHPHAADVTEEGRVLVFDNGNVRHTPYDPVPEPEAAYSQVTAFDVDAGSGTVRLAWTYRQTLLGELFAPTFGDADALPNGHVLAVFGRTLTVDGRTNTEAGRGQSTAHLVELDPQDPADPALHLVLSSRRAELAGGWSTYRAERIRGFYPWEAESL
ncbi:MAG: aryl-sulfate sulfotransferase [Myxococcales bacterium]|nr:aryl-sulfate sulfotransferase [Myxococcales bacterium]